jgi:GNAT superfamily N-acetyltransferase
MRSAVRVSDPEPDPESASYAGLVIREAEPAHYASIRAALILAYYEHQAVLPPHLFSAYLSDLLDLEARLGSAQLLAAWRGGRVVGTVSFYPDAAALRVGWPPGWSAVRALGVTPQARGNGVGRQLMEACLSRAREAGVKAMGLHTGDFMHEAVRLYWQLGFRPAPGYDFEIPGGGPPMSGASYDPGRPMAHAYVRYLP